MPPTLTLKKTQTLTQPNAGLGKIFVWHARWDGGGSVMKQVTTDANAFNSQASLALFKNFFGTI